jgi:biotin operon repressor
VKKDTYEKKLYTVLKKHHTGKENAIVSKQLKSLVGTKRSEVCRIVSRLRREGVPICSCSNGYFYPRSYSEVLDVVSRFTQYGSTLRATSSALRSSSVKS